ncbi:MAG TPA: outer membrane lipoprotein carrier protein LolA [Bacteroidetes bacterium]|nr:outer membrane lipoprotein carrier protein LolA [Bacteroidota bacterium]
MKKFKITAFFFLVIFTGMAMAQVPDGFTAVANVKIIKDGVKQASANTFSLSSDFVQEKHLTMMDEVLVSKGLFLFKKENNVKWEYVSPIHYAILIRGNHFVINNDGKISEFDTGSNKLFKEINNMIVMAIRGNFVDNPDFTASFYENRSFYLVSLSPVNEQLKGIIQSIDIYFDKKDFGVRKVKFVEPGEDFTLIRFENRKTNIDLPDDQFKVKHE